MATREPVFDDLRAAVAPLLPEMPGRPKGGRPRCGDRDAPRGIVFVPRSGIPREMPPREAFGCSGMTCRPRLRDRQRAGAWDQLHRVALERLHQTRELDRGRKGDEAGPWPRRGYASVRNAAGPNPTDRGEPATKPHAVTDRRGTPPGPIPAGANRHDSMAPVPVLDAIPGVRTGGRGQPRKRPSKLRADTACDSRRCRMARRAGNIATRIARKGIESSAHPGRHRWVVERTFARFTRFRRIATRCERRADIHKVFTTLAAAIICNNQTRRSCRAL